MDRARTPFPPLPELLKLISPTLSSGSRATFDAAVLAVEPLLSGVTDTQIEEKKRQIVDYAETSTHHRGRKGLIALARVFDTVLYRRSHKDIPS